MGLFSWKCCKCGEPIMAGFTLEREQIPLGEAVLLINTPEMELKVTSTYDGYGRVGSIDIMDVLGMLDEKFFRMVHQCCYDNEEFEDLSENKNDTNQGYFYDSNEVDSMIRRLKEAGILN